ncbi:hypothetical protein Tco_0276807 [Tanacetum coccineum]
MAVRTQPTLSSGYSAKLTKVMALSPFLFLKRNRSSYETPSSSSPSSLPTLPLRKRYKGTSKLMENIETKSIESKDEGTYSKDEETAPEARRRVLERARDTVPSTYEVGHVSGSTPNQQLEIAGETPTLTHASQSLPAPVRTSPSSFGIPASPEWSLESLSVSSVIPSSVASLALATALDEDVLLEIKTQLELHGSMLHTHSERLDTLPPSRFKGYDRDFTELFSRIEAVREEIHTQRFRLSGLEYGQEEIEITIGALWRPILALEA